MSGFIHIAHETPVWQKALRAGAALTAVVGGLAWCVFADEGLPMDTPSAAVPFVKAQPLPARPRSATSTDGDDEDEAQADPRQLAKAAAALGTAEADDDDFAARNAGIDVRRLTLQRPQTARAFLSEVLLTPGAPSGFVVAEVLPQSRYERMGLKPGDVVYTLDTPGTPSVDENSMVALMQQSELSLEVYRNGMLTRLHTDLAHLENGDAPSAR